MTDCEGRQFPNRGVSVIRLEAGKVVEARDYIFDLDGLNAAYEEA